MSRRRQQASASAWWSEPGPATCDFCLRTFHVEVGYHCADCDRPVCPACVLRIRERRTLTCPECHAEAGEQPLSGDPG